MGRGCKDQGAAAREKWNKACRKEELEYSIAGVDWDK